jgi:nucleoid DNA-binding protein
MKDYKMAITEGTAKKKAPVKKKTVAKKPLAMKAAVKKAPVKKNVITKKVGAKKAATPFRRATAISERYNKIEIVNELALNSGLNRKQINTVLDELCLLVQRHVKKRAVGEFILSGLVKITTVKKPAKKARKGINTFTGKETIFKAKPATNAVKVYALKGLRDMAN